MSNLKRKCTRALDEKNDRNKTAKTSDEESKGRFKVEVATSLPTTVNIVLDIPPTSKSAIAIQQPSSQVTTSSVSLASASTSTSSSSSTLSLLLDDNEHQLETDQRLDEQTTREQKETNQEAKVIKWSEAHRPLVRSFIGQVLKLWDWAHNKVPPSTRTIKRLADARPEDDIGHLLVSSLSVDSNEEFQLVLLVEATWKKRADATWINTLYPNASQSYSISDVLGPFINTVNSIITGSGMDLFTVEEFFLSNEVMMNVVNTDDVSTLWSDPNNYALIQNHLWPRLRDATFAVNRGESDVLFQQMNHLAWNALIRLSMASLIQGLTTQSLSDYHCSNWEKDVDKYCGIKIDPWASQTLKEVLQSNLNQQNVMIAVKKYCHKYECAWLDCCSVWLDSLQDDYREDEKALRKEQNQDQNGRITDDDDDDDDEDEENEDDEEDDQLTKADAN